MTKLIEIMEAASNPKAQAIAQLKEGLQKVLNQQTEIPASIKLGLDDNGVALQHPDENDIDFENCMTMVCGLNDICDALKTLRLINVVPYLSDALENIGNEEILKPVIEVLESRSDASSEMIEKIEDYLALSKFMTELSIYFDEGSSKSLYRFKASDYNDVVNFTLDLKNHNLNDVTRFLNQLSPLLKSNQPDITESDEGRFVLSEVQTQGIFAQIKIVAKAAIQDPKTSPEIADSLFNLMNKLPPEDDDIRDELNARLFDKMSPAARIEYVQDLADLVIATNKPDSPIDDLILGQYAATVEGLMNEITKHGGVAQMIGLEPSLQAGLDLEDRKPN